MTATQVLFLFFKECCTIEEMRFFKHIILKDNGNKYFRKRPLYTSTFVEDYLSRNGRALNNYMTRLFILAPNLTLKRYENPRWKSIKIDFNKRNEGRRYLVYDEYEPFYRPCIFKSWNSGMYVNYYKRKWKQFLKENIESNKKFNSPFKKGENYNFKLKIK